MKPVPLWMMVAALAASGTALADPAGAMATVRATEVKLGAPFTVEAKLPGTDKDSWTFKPLPPDSPFAVLGQKQTRSPSGVTLRLQLGLYALGAQALPPVTLVSSSGREVVLPGGQTVSGTGTLAKGDVQLRPLAGPRVPLIFAWRVALLAGGLAALVLLVLGAGVRAAVRWRMSPSRRDRRALERLMASRCSDREFYLALDGIVRRHLARRHGIPALERTSTELSMALAPHPGLPASELAHLFQEADLVKFAERPARPGRRDADATVALEMLLESPRRSRGSHARPAFS